MRQNNSKSAAESISHSLKIYDNNEKRLKLSGQGTDAGGGGTREDLARELEKIDRGKEMDEYNLTICALHAMNLTLSSPTELTMGLGGLKRRTSLQLLHSAYNLAQNYRHQR